MRAPLHAPDMAPMFIPGLMPLPPGSVGVVDMPASPFLLKAAETSSARPGQLLPASVADGALDSTRIEAAFEQLLAQLSLRGESEKEPDERRESDDRALRHHHRPRKRLVVESC